MRLVLVQALPAPPAVIWPLITDPPRMNLWSLARIDLASPGDGDAPAGVGALRRVTLRAPTGPLTFEEVIEHAEPPHRLVYRVVRGLPVSGHRGEITLTRAGAGSLLAWEVDFTTPIAAVGLAARELLEGQLRRSLEALARTARVAPEEELAPPGPRAAPDPGLLRSPTPAAFRDDEAEVPKLLEEAEAVLVAQRQLADRLARERDPKQWFTRVYEYVTEEQVGRCREGSTTHRAWVLRIIPRFHAYYVGNLRCWMGDAPGRPESHWERAFAEMDRARGHGAARILQGVLRGAAAHIEEDLPRVLAEVFRHHYAGRCSYARFRADYLLMADVFRRAEGRLVAELPRDSLPLPARLVEPWLPAPLRARISDGWYDVPEKRREAFERGGRLSAWPG